MPDFSPHCTPTGSKMAAENISQTIAQLLLIRQGLTLALLRGRNDLPNTGWSSGWIHPPLATQQ